MSLVSIRLPDDVEVRLAREAELTNRAKSEVARDAIVDYLNRQARERFLEEIAKAARARGDGEALKMAAEALAFDNESLLGAELVPNGPLRVHEPKARYGTRTRKKR